MTGLRRALIVGAVAVAVLVVGGWLGVRAYLSSHYARSLASNRLTQALGLPVEVEALSVGGQSSTLKFRVTEPATSPDRAPAEILKVESASADVSLTDLIEQKVAPTELKVESASLTLRVDRNGKLLTQLPASNAAGGSNMKVPAVAVRQATLRIQQEGRPEFVCGNADLQLAPQGDTVAITGTVKDPRWGDLTVKGSFATPTKSGWVELASESLALSPELVRSLPYVPSVTWDHLQPHGRSGAVLRLDVGKGGDLTYDLVLTPAGKTDLHLPDLGKAEQATLKGVEGRVHVRGERVDLAGCKGVLAGGTVGVDGDADFQPEPSVMKFRVTAQGLDVTQLPPEWGVHFPKELGGRLRGSANLEVRVAANGDVEPRGGGEAVVQFSGLAVGSAEATFKLESNGKGYRFHKAEKPAAAAGDKASSWRAGPRSRPRPAVSPRHAGRAGAMRANAHQAPPAPKAKDEPSTIDAALTLRNVDVAELLKKLNLSLPYAIKGQVTAKVTVTVPLNRATTLRSYKLVGNFSSPEFKVEGLTVQELSADLTYDKGVLTLTALKGKMPGGAGPAGSFLGTASAGIEPRGDLAANLDLDRFPLGDAVKALAGPTIDVGGRISGKGRFQAPLERIKDFATWNAAATVTSDELTVFGRTVRQAAVGLTVADGTARLADSRATVEGLPVTVDGTLALAAPYKFEAAVKTSPTQIADLRKLVPNDPVPLAVEGKLRADAKATGTLSPLAYSASGTASATDLKLGLSEGNTLDLKWAVDPQHVEVTDVAAAAFKGTFGGSADIPFDATRAGKFDITMKDLDSEAVSKSLAGFPMRLSGRISGRFNGALPAARPGEPRTVTGDLDLTAPQLTVQGIPAERLVGKVGFANEAANYELEGRTLGGSFELKGKYPFRQAKADPKEQRGTFRLRGVDLRRAAAAFKIRSLGDLEGTTDFQLDFRNDLSEGSGRFDVRDVAWGDHVLTDGLTGAVRLADGVLTVNDFGGEYAGGELRGRARVEMHDPRRNSVSVTLDRADAKLLLAPLGSAGEAVEGTVSATFRGRVGPNTSGGGQVELSRGSLFGFAVSSLRVPYEVAAAGGGYGQLDRRRGLHPGRAGPVDGRADVQLGADRPARGQDPVLRRADALGPVRRRPIDEHLRQRPHLGPAGRRRQQPALGERHHRDAEARP